MPKEERIYSITYLTGSFSVSFLFFFFFPLGKLVPSKAVFDQGANWLQCLLTKAGVLVIVSPQEWCTSILQLGDVL